MAPGCPVRAQVMSHRRPQSVDASTDPTEVVTVGGDSSLVSMDLAECAAGLLH